MKRSFESYSIRQQRRIKKLFTDEIGTDEEVGENEPRISAGTVVKLKISFFLFQFNPLIKKKFSGEQVMNKYCDTEKLLETRLDENMWQKVLDTWRTDEECPEFLTKLVKQAVPEKLRGQVWQRLCTYDDSEEILNNYRMLLSKVNHNFFRFFPYEI